MSDNLHASINSKELDLYQTPTNITHMFLVNSDGISSNKMAGKNAKRVIHMYLLWIREQILNNTKYSSISEYMKSKEIIEEHIKSIKEKMDNGKSFNVWWV